MTAFNAALSGLRVSQRVIDMVAHNLANAETPGFKVYEEHNFEMGPFPVVSGVGTNIVRAEDQLLDDQLQSATIAKQSADLIADAFNKLDTVPFDELNTSYSKLMDATHLLLRTPNDTVAQQDFNKSAEGFQKSLDRFGDRLDQIKSDITLSMELSDARITQIREKLQELSSRNGSTEEINALKSELMQQTGSVDAYKKILSSIIPPVDSAFVGASEFVKQSINTLSGQTVFGANGVNTVTDFSTFNEVPLPEWDSHWFNTEIGKIRASVGYGSQDADTDAAYAGKLLDELSGEYNSRFGVDLVEQQVKAMRYQRMYESNAQMIKVQDEMFKTLLSIV